MFIQGPRAQIDRKLYKKHMQQLLFNYPGLDVLAGSVFDLNFEHSELGARISGVTLGTFTFLKTCKNLLMLHQITDTFLHVLK